MKILCFGDSNTYGYDPRSYFGGRYPETQRWPELLAAQTGWQVANGGENGRCIPRSAALPGGFDRVVIMLGTNDLLQGASPESAAARMETFLQGLGTPPASLLLIAPPPLQPSAWVEEESLPAASRRLAVLYKELAARLGVPFADAGAWGVSLAFDGVHFTPQGHAAFAAGLMKELWR